jgi:hypothetical protein
MAPEELSSGMQSTRREATPAAVPATIGGASGPAPVPTALIGESSGSFVAYLARRPVEDRAAVLGALHRTSGNHAVQNLLLREPPATAPPAPAPPAGKTIMKYALIGKVQPALGLHPQPDRATPELRELKFNDRIFVRTELPGSWYSVLTDDGQEGYVWKKNIFLNPPEPKATLYQVESGRTAFLIARDHYSKHIVDDADLRFFVNALVHVNGGEGNPSKGIYRDKDDAGDWEETKTTAGKYIWIPSPEYALTLRGVVKSGSREDEGWDALLGAAGEFVAEFVEGLLEGGRQSLIDLFEGMRELAEQIWALMQASFADIAVAAYEWVKDLSWEKVKAFAANIVSRVADFDAKWNQRNPYKLIHFRGHVIGYLLMDFLVGEVIGAALQLAGRLPSAAARALEGFKGSRQLVKVAEEVGVARRVERYLQEAKGEVRAAGKAATPPKLPGPEPPPKLPAPKVLGPEPPPRVYGPPAPDPYAKLSDRRLKKLAESDKQAAEALRDRYEKLPNKKLREKARNGDAMAKSVLDARVPKNTKLDDLRGSKGDVRMRHHAGAKVTDARGRVRWSDEFQSGDMEKPQDPKDWRKKSQESHTERRAIAKAKLQRGETLWIRGQYDPCSFCQEAMRAASEGGRTVDYWWPGGHFRAADGKIVIPVPKSK